MKFKKGNQTARKKGRLCQAYPFCTNRIPNRARPNKRYCHFKCRKYTNILLKRILGMKA